MSKERALLYRQQIELINRVLELKSQRRKLSANSGKRSVLDSRINKLQQALELLEKQLSGRLAMLRAVG